MDQQLEGRSTFRGAQQRAEVTTTELFFDLAYVFAFIQLTSLLAHALTAEGAVKAAIVFGAVWWVWIYTAWTTGLVNPLSRPGRLFLLYMMVCSLIMSAALPAAFADRGWEFALAVVAMQVGRPLFVMIAAHGHPLARTYGHILAWSGAASVLWLAGAALEGRARLLVWAAAVAVDYLGPAIDYAVPMLGRRPLSQWPISPGHLAERSSLILMIALGETVLHIGGQYAATSASWRSLTALFVAFTQIAAFWWLYFARHSDDARRRVQNSADAGRLGRIGYTYAHAPMIASIIVAAVGIEHLLDDPLHHLDLVTGLVMSGGAAGYVLGLAAFIRGTGGLDRFERWIAVFVVGTLAITLAANLAMHAPLLIHAAIIAAVISAACGAAAVHART